MSVELETAYVSITTDTKKLAGGIREGMADGAKQGTKAVERTTASGGTKAGKGFATKFGKAAKAGMAVAGAGIAAAAGFGMNRALENEVEVNKLSAALGLNPEEQKKAGEAAGKIYAKSMNASMADVTGAMDAVGSSLGISPASAELEGLTQKALTLSQVMETDVADTASAAGILIKNGLAKDGAEAFDLLGSTMQGVPKKAREEVLEATSEYTKHFQTLGLTGVGAMKMIQFGAKDGIIGLDKTGDALKEVSMIAGESSKSVDAAYSELGLNREAVSRAFASGGPEAEKAMSQIAGSLLSIVDPAQRVETALTVFGSPLGDLGTQNIPAFLTALKAAPNALNQATGAMDKMSDTMNSGVAYDVNALKKSFEGLVTGAMGQLAPVMVPFLNAMTQLAPVLVPVAGGLAAAAAATWLVNAALAANPIALAVGAFAALAAGITWVATQTTFFQDTWNGMVAAVVAGADWVREKWAPVAQFFSDLWGKITAVTSAVGIGGSGGSFSGGSIPGLAEGGTVTRSGTTLVGERGPELLNLPRGSQVVPLTADDIAPYGSAGNGSAGVTVNLTQHNPVQEKGSSMVAAAQNLFSAALAI